MDQDTTKRVLEMWLEEIKATIDAMLEKYPDKDIRALGLVQVEKPEGDHRWLSEMRMTLNFDPEWVERSLVTMLRFYTDWIRDSSDSDGIAASRYAMVIQRVADEGLKSLSAGAQPLVEQAWNDLHNEN